LACLGFPRGKAELGDVGCEIDYSHIPRHVLGVVVPGQKGVAVKLELRNITKRFGTLVANDGISLTVGHGQIHGLLGENGAGKSTLMNVLYGLLKADSGEILLDDEIVHFNGPGDAIAAGVGMVHQHFMLIQDFTVAENVILGDEPTLAGGRLDMAAARERVVTISERFGFDIDPDAVVADLPVGLQQRVEIVKALSRNAKVLVLDEPTAVLTPQETDELMEIMKGLASAGTSIVFITHKLREVREVCDVITVIRQGKVVATAAPDSSLEDLAGLMVGRSVDLSANKSPATPGDLVLEVENLSVTNSRGVRVVDNVSLTVRSGEIVALAGVQGNGQSELVEALIGLHPLDGGTIALDGEVISESSVKWRLSQGIGYVPEDRKKDGLVGAFSIAENLMLDRTAEETFSRGASVNMAGRDEFSREAIANFDIRTPSSRTLGQQLSGGNQQKVVLARELTKALKLLVASQPTRGVDVGSIEFIHEQIVKARDSGVAVLIVSTELDELYALADRILVMYRGAIVGEVTPDVSRERLGALMAGVVSA
jgi:general nucleoside transport system ATP-binding protein